MAAGVRHVIHFGGEPVNSVRRAWKTARKLAEFEGEDYGPHILRHTAATWLMRSGVDPWDGAGFLGMTVDTLLSVYGHHHPNFQQGASSFTGKPRKAIAVRG
jgi:integrase